MFFLFCYSLFESYCCWSYMSAQGIYQFHKDYCFLLYSDNNTNVNLLECQSVDIWHWVKSSMVDQISVIDFLTETKDDINSPTTSIFTSKMTLCRATIAALEEVCSTICFDCFSSKHGMHVIFCLIEFGCWSFCSEKNEKCHKSIAWIRTRWEYHSQYIVKALI